MADPIALLQDLPLHIWRQQSHLHSHMFRTVISRQGWIQGRCQYHRGWYAGCVCATVHLQWGGSPGALSCR